MRLQNWATGAAMLFGAVVLQGCALLVVGAAVGVGAVSYVGNELRVTQEVTVDRAWDAAQGALAELKIPIISGKSHKDATGGTLIARNARDQEVQIQFVRQSDRLTEIRVRIGIFDTAANRAAAQLVYDKMRARF